MEFAKAEGAVGIDQSPARGKLDCPDKPGNDGGEGIGTTSAADQDGGMTNVCAWLLGNSVLLGIIARLHQAFGKQGFAGGCQGG